MTSIFGDEFDKDFSLSFKIIESFDDILQNHDQIFKNYNDLISNFESEANIKGNKEQTFETSKKTSNDSKKDIKFLVENPPTKKGRKTNRNNNNGHKCHNKDSIDNILRKVQVHYISFIIEYANAILRTISNSEFRKINQKYKITVNKAFTQSIKRKNISEILCQDISTKYKKIENKKINKQIFDAYPELKQIFSETYIDLFKNIYYSGKREITLTINGENIIISLKGIKMFNDFLSKMGKKESPEYINKIKKCVKEHFLN